MAICKCCGKEMCEKLTKTLSDKQLFECDCGHKEEKLNDPVLYMNNDGYTEEEK